MLELYLNFFFVMLDFILWLSSCLKKIILCIADLLLSLNVCVPTAKEPKDADIIWTSVQVDEDMKKATGITDQQYINQFPFEASLVMKHHLAETIQKVIIVN